MSRHRERLRPRVIVHVAISVDGATVGFDPDVQVYYELAARWHEDVTLTGADTILAQEEALARVPRPGPNKGGPLLAVVDSRHRVTAWAALRDCGHWSEVVALRAKQPTTSSDQPAPREIVAGETRVDLAAALRVLAREGVEVVRVDSGGTLNGVLLTATLVDEVSLLVHPLIAGRPHRHWHGGADGRLDLDLIELESLGDDLVWLHYARSAQE